MTVELAKAYDPKEAQERWLAFWEERGFFHAEPEPARKPYTIVIPPPNVTGALHMGHALNNTLQDVLIRWRRMQGYNALWMPGTDHAGIATQAVVEKLLFQQEKKTRHDLGREQLVERIWQWKDKYETRILGQLRQLGCSCDWQRTRFTLDPICARAVRETFFRMFKDGLIFRGKRLVNWDVHLQTSVADDETYTENTKGGFWTFKYPVTDQPDTIIRFSTTRPETMLGDTAVCVHPSDERYQHVIGKTVTIPLNGRTIPIIADGLLADPELGTGCVKVTPAHDPNDYACYLRHPDIGIINILNPNGTINEQGGKYAGLDRMKAREAVVQAMEELGFYEGKEDREIPLKFSDRSKTPIEPYLSDQWFVKMGDREDGAPGLAQQTIDAVTSGRVKFFPERYAKTYLDWLGEKRDWCISRQLWWGHRIPVWRRTMALASGDATQPWEKLLAAACCPAEQEVVAVQRIQSSDDKEVTWLLSVRPGYDALEKLLDADGWVQDDDVLDTWFSSALWPHSTLGWPEKTPELAQFYPTSTLVTSRDIITLWVARMVMTGLYNLGEVPFHDVYIHTKMLDGFGETMSKTKGNGIDPLDIVDRYGADALRFIIVQLATETQDSRMPVSNVCPHCGALVAVKQEHMYMRTRRLVCPECKKAFRPGGPWPGEDAELPTARQASERFEVGRNFANKIWNAARFLLMNLDGYQPQPLDLAALPIEDRWILSRLQVAAEAVTSQLEGYHFSEVARTLYDFIWSEFCDWYVEMAKGRLRGADKNIVQNVLVGVLDAVLRLVQPIMPFVAESIWQALNEAAPVRGLPAPASATASVTVAPWPEIPASWHDDAVEQPVRRMQELVGVVREIRNRYKIRDARAPLDTYVRCAAPVAADVHALAAFIHQLAGVGKLEAGPDVVKPSQAAGVVTPDFQAYVSLQGLIDVGAEVARLQKQLADKRKALDSTRAKLDNPNFVGKAPPEVIAQQRAQVADLQTQIDALAANIQELQA